MAGDDPSADGHATVVEADRSASAYGRLHRVCSRVLVAAPVSMEPATAGRVAQELATAIMDDLGGAALGQLVDANERRLWLARQRELSALIVLEGRVPR
jgi:hypothetical protein